MSFAWNLKTLRTQADLTQGELASKIGVSQKTLSSWETARTEPNIGEVIRICETLNCTMEKITGIKMHDEDDITLEEILLKLRSLSFEDLKKLKDMTNEAIEHKKMLSVMEAKRKEQLARIAEYEAEIEKLKRQIAEGTM